MGTRDLPPDLGQTLASLRTNAELKQAEVARKLSIDPSRISRIETGEILPTKEEVEAYLKALGTPDSQMYREFLNSEWRVLARPPFRHPQREVLWTAETYLCKLDEFSAQQDIPAPLLGQAEMHRQSLRRIADYLHPLEHSVAFVGEIGVGKTTAVCALTGLVLPGNDKPVNQRVALETGAGGTTVCEVRIRSGHRFGIIVEPHAESEIYKFVGELCAGLRDYGQSPAGKEKQEKGVPREIDRALRNMAELTRSKRQKGDESKSKSDPAAELAQKFENLDDLRSEFSSRLRLWHRTRREIWTDEQITWEAGLEWLKKTFSDINNGRVEDFSLPRRIDLIIPGELFRDNGLTPEIIDTKGVDQTAIRPDLKHWLDDPRAITVLCSSFNTAPAPTMQQLMEHLQATGAERALSERVVLLVLPKSGEALAMKDDAGETATTEHEGYELKHDQIRGALTNISASGVPTLFFNVNADNPKQITSTLLERLSTMRQAQADRIKSVTSAINKMFADKEEAWMLQAQAAVNKMLKIFLDQHRALPTRRRPVYQQVLKGLDGVHQRTLWATTRRRGMWSNFNIYYHLGASASTEVKSRSQTTFNALEALIRNKLGDPDLKPTHDFLNELLENVSFWRENFIEAVRRAGEETFRPTLEDDDGFWSACEDIYGTGDPFRQEVAKRLEAWFEAPEREHLHALLESRLETAWRTTFLEPLAKLCDERPSKKAA